MAGYDAGKASAKAEEDWSDDEEETKVAGPQLRIEVAPSTDVADGGESMVAISIRVPEANGLPSADASSPPVLNRTASGKVERPPTDVCCVIDISGSMSQEATYEDENENVKSDGLSYLDIVKHATRAVMHILKDQDRLAIVAFDDKADIAFALDYMTAEKREKATEALQAMRPRGRTDIWNGLRAGMDELRTKPADGGPRSKTLMLLTDGIPNEVPPRGHIPELRDYKETHPDFSFMINTFGFGYRLDSALLLDLAIEGQGTYGFIPDALIVGTSFVDSAANILSTHTQKAQVHLTATGGAEFAGAVLGVGEHMVSEATWGRVINLGPLQSGGTREVVVPMKIPAGDKVYLDVTVVYPGASGKEEKACGQGTSRKAAQFAVEAHSRSDMVSSGYEAVRLADGNQQDAAQTSFAALATRVGEREASGGAWVTQLKADIEGRASKALVGKDRYNRWGKHYLRAFTRAHQVQYCTNYMDKSLQEYGGALFKACREEGDSVFLSLPPPEPTARRTTTTNRASYSATPTTSASAASAPDMNVYYGGSGGG